MQQPRSAILHQQVRRAMLDGVAERPGVALTQISDALGLDYNTTLYHARVLHKCGALVMDEGGRRALYPPGAARPAAAPRVLRALEAVHAGAGTPAMLARELGLTRGGAGSLLEALEKRGLVRREAASWRVVSEHAAVALGLPPRGGG